MLTSLQTFFDVSTNDIRDRLLLSLRAITTLRSGNDCEPVFKDTPDMYGPFWITSTAILAISVSQGLTVDFTATCILYGCLLIFPLLVFALHKALVKTATDPSVSYPHLVCVYGYSNVAVIPVALLRGVLPPLARDVVLAFGAGHTATFLLANVPYNPRAISLGTALACQGITYCMLYYS